MALIDCASERGLSLTRVAASRTPLSLGVILKRDWYVQSRKASQFEAPKVATSA